ncbi:hypothetical protein MPH_00213 [Macrophomina phaseolina MS6]|uniref:Uncharacterized protein n=1 Tax=Macrophomina phaseolina (strain MS6) TaxID=1126212 RepID=K2S6D3_MACPH|nr:hypothetical protein MPH_00213 [Macrophomina phaseolina MS6]
MGAVNRCAQSGGRNTRVAAMFFATGVGNVLPPCVLFWEIIPRKALKLCSTSPKIFTKIGKMHRNRSETGRVAQGVCNSNQHVNSGVSRMPSIRIPYHQPTEGTGQQQPPPVLPS